MPLASPPRTVNSNRPSARQEYNTQLDAITEHVNEQLKLVKQIEAAMISQDNYHDTLSKCKTDLDGANIRSIGVHDQIKQNNMIDKWHMPPNTVPLQQDLQPHYREHTPYASLPSQTRPPSPQT